MTEVNLPLVIGAAVIDSINPCAFGVLIFLLAYLSKTTKSAATMLMNGFVYILAVFLTYFAAGLLLLPIIQQLGGASVIAYLVLGILIILAGLIELKDVFFPGHGFSLSIMPKEAERIKKYVKKVSNKPTTAFGLGVFVALVELPCTGAVYLAVLALMTMAGITASHLLFLVLYNLIFVLPLIIILISVTSGVSTAKFEAWRQKHKQLMRLMTGVLLLGLGTWMVMYVL